MCISNMFPVTTLRTTAPKGFYELESVGTGDSLFLESFWTQPEALVWLTSVSCAHKE